MQLLLGEASALKCNYYRVMQDGPDPRYKQALIALIIIKFMYLGKRKIHLRFDMWELYHHNKLEAFT